MRLIPKALAKLALLALLACDGKLGGGELGPRLVEAPLACGAVALPAESPQLTRLPHVQYDYVLADLFGLPSSAATRFPPDPVLGGFDNNAEALRVDARLLADYQLAAEATAAQVVATAASLSAAVPCTPAGDGAACARQFVESFGRRAFRRPLTAAEVERYLALFAAGATLYAEGTSFERGVRLVLEGMLQSPHFLYRAELDGTPETVGGAELVRLPGFTIASRLAATLWASIPDDELLDAAAAGGLDTPEGIRAQALRMVESDKVLRVIDDFHAQWLAAREFGVDPKMPPLPDSVGDSMRRELEAFVRHVDAGVGTYEELMTAPYTFVDQNLAPLYGVVGSFGAEPQRVDLDPAERAGLLTQVGILSAHSGAVTSSPIHRGVFVLRHFLCSDVAPPNFAIDPTLPERTGDIVTTRDQVEHHTANATCQACHRTINAVGFGLEHFGASGEYRTHDNGAVVDASGDVEFEDATLAFTDGVSLAHAIVDSGLGARCYIDRWLGYSFGRVPNAADRCTATLVDEQFQGGPHRLRDVLVAITDSIPFRYRLEEK